MALGQLDDALQAGEGALSWLGDRVPQTRSLILSTLASSLRAAGRLEEAYDALDAGRRARTPGIPGALRAAAEARAGDAARRARLATTSAALAAKNRQLAEAHAELERRAGELEALQEQLRDQAERDWLTGLHNRRYFARELERLSSRAATGSWLSLADRRPRPFQVRSTTGSATRSATSVLVRVAALLCDVLRQSDVVVRSGGEEFLVLMPVTEMNAATACCERIRRRIREEHWEHFAAGLTVTASAGVAATDDPGQHRSAHALGRPAALRGQAPGTRPRRERPARALRGSLAGASLSRQAIPKALIARDPRSAARSSRALRPRRERDASASGLKGEGNTSEALRRCGLPVAP